MNWTKVLTWKFPEDTISSTSFDWENIYLCLSQFIFCLMAVMKEKRVNLQASLWFYLFFQISHLSAHITKSYIYWYFVHYFFLLGGVFLAKEFRKTTKWQFFSFFVIDTLGWVFLGQLFGVFSGLTLTWWAVAKDKWLNSIFLFAASMTFLSLLLNDVFEKGNHHITEFISVAVSTICNIAIFWRSK